MHRNCKQFYADLRSSGLSDLAKDLGIPGEVIVSHNHQYYLLDPSRKQRIGFTVAEAIEKLKEKAVKKK